MWARLFYLKSYAGRLNSFQRDMIATLFCIVPERLKPYDAYRQRLHLRATSMAKEMGLWGNEWTQRAVKWAAHVEADHDSFSWSQHLLHWHGPEWLDWQRWLCLRPNRSCTNTRCCRGVQAKRWLEGLDSAKHLLGPT